MAVNAELLEAKGISKGFPGVQALADVTLVVRRGRVHALLGENGAGKSTLMNILAGVFPPDHGEIVLEGRAVSFRDPREAREAGIAVIFQELNLIPHLSVAQNIFLGREPLTRGGLIDDARMNREGGSWLERLELEVNPRTIAGHLRVGQQQVVEIAKALSLNARVIIMDEPTSAITEHEVAVLFGLVRRLKDEGVAIIYITHKLGELGIADDVTVLRDGRLVGARPAREVTHDEIIRMMVGRAPGELRTPGSERQRTFQLQTSEFKGAPGAKRDAKADELLRVEALSLEDAERPGEFLVRDVTFTLRRGEVLGLFGLMGAGRTELLEALAGLHPRRVRGEVFLGGEPARFSSPREAIAAGLALAPEDRKRDGLVLSLSVAANASLAALEQTERWGLIDADREAELAGSYVDRLGIKTPSTRQLVRNLSGGNQQKVVLAKWLATKPKVLLLDEPTRGIDVGAKSEVCALIDDLVRSGLGVVFVSSELPEILGVADRILVLCEGRVTAEFARSEATEEKIMKAALPK